jgi:Uma2 family endonuclease
LLAIIVASYNALQQFFSHLMSTKVEATIEDLYKIDGKAELVNGEIVHMSPTGQLPHYAALEITVSLREYEKLTGHGYSVGDNAAFVVNLPNRKSFSPYAAFHICNLSGMKFFEGAPVFAVEVRNESDYGARAERQLAKKRDDYFAAGTLVVWEVDVLSENVVRVYRANDPATPKLYRRGQQAEAEPAVPGWSIAVNDLFPDESKP